MKNIIFYTIIASLFIFSIQTVTAQQFCGSSQCAAGEVCIAGTYCVAQPTGLKTDFQGPGALTNIVTAGFFFVIPVVGIIGFLFFLWTGFEFLTSKGDPKALAAAKARLTYAVIGLILIFMSFIITNFVADLFNIALDI